MKRLVFLLPLLCLFVTLSLNAETCTQTGFVRDGINMSAAIINPTGPVTGSLVTSCNIGVYIDNADAKIDTADISGANYFGVVVNGDTNTVSASITNTNIHNIGEVPQNGTQHGVGIYFRALSLAGSASGTISNTTVSAYQKGGIVLSGQGVNVAVTDNIVQGNGAIPYIAQNGIQVSYGAMASVMRNKVTGNSYSGTAAASSGGILVVGGPCFGAGLPFTVNTRIIQNTLDGNDVAVFIFQASDTACVALPTTQTNIKVVNNTITKGSANNCCGWDGSVPYTAGVSDFGVNDKIVANSITGYTANLAPSTGQAIDTTGSAKVKVQANKD